MTSDPNGHNLFRNGLINEAGRKRRDSDALPSDIDRYVPLLGAASKEEHSSAPRHPSSSYWQQVGIQLGRQLIGLGTGVLKRLLLWRPKDIFGAPLLLIILWCVALWWGEEAVFRRKVEDCSWDRWETWVCLFNSAWQTLLPRLLLTL